MWDQDWGLPRVKRGSVGCNPTSLAPEDGIGYIVKRAKRAQRRKSWGQAAMVNDEHASWEHIIGEGGGYTQLAENKSNWPRSLFAFTPG